MVPLQDNEPLVFKMAPSVRFEFKDESQQVIARLRLATPDKYIEKNKSINKICQDCKLKLVR